MIVLIPAYEPDEKLPALVSELRAANASIRLLIVDDGSGQAYSPVFAQAASRGGHVIGYANNRGKGYALKAGFHYIAENWPNEAVVCADSDGQHSVVDILRVASTLESTGNIVLGERRFSGDVPLRSRFGNSASRIFFGLATGRWLHDTQTGLRGYPPALLPWLQGISGERYEYELNILLAASSQGMSIETLEIATIYLEDNRSSHFRPIHDSARIYAPLLKFAASSFSGFAVDVVAFMVILAFSGSLLGATVGARILSAGVNFTINRSVVFPEARSQSFTRAALNYLLLAVALLAANFAVIFSLTTIGVPSLPAKILTETLLFVSSFVVQKRFLFKSGGHTSQDSQVRLAASTHSAQEHAEI